MTSLQRDPRKQYVLDKRNCKDLSVTQKLYHPDCRKEATKERAINPKPRPQPTPTPKPKPNVPDLPPQPGVPYSFRTPGDIDFSPTAEGGVNPAMIAFAGVAGAGVLGEAGIMARRYRATGRVLPRTDGYRRVPTRAPTRDIEMGETRRPPRPSGRAFDEQAPRARAPRLRTTSFQPGEDEFGREDINEPLQEEPRFDERTGRRLNTRSSRGLRYRRVPTTEPVEEAPMEEVPLDEAPRPVQSRIPRIRFPRAKPPSMEAPKMPTQLTEAPTQASETELTEAQAREAQLRSDLDDLVNEARAQQASVSQAEEQVTELQGEGTADEAVTETEGAEATAEAEAGAEAGEEATLGAEGIAAEGGAVEGAVSGATEAGVSGAEGGFGAMEAGVGEAAGGEEVVGGGPEDPLADIAAGATAVFGTIGVAIASLFGGGKPAEYKNIKGTAVMSSSDVKSALSKVKTKLSSSKQGTPTYNSLLALQNSLTNAQTNKTDVVSFKDAQGKSDLAIPLSTAQLATAIKVYQQNPNAYNGMDTTKLEVMGLSPEMAKGEAGATKTSIGYIPTMDGDKTFTTGAGGGNWTNFYVSGVRKGIFTSNSNIDTLAVPDAKQKKQMDDNYIAKATTIINAEKDPAVKAYLKYELNLFKYNNGYIPDKPTPVPKPTLTTAQQAQMTQLTDALNNKKAQLTAIQNSISTKQSILDGINTQINNINIQSQARAKTIYQEQLKSYQTQANAYNQQLAQNVDETEQQTASANIMYARATNTPINAPVGRYLTKGQIQSFQQQLATGQIKTTGVTPITTLTPPLIRTRANGSPIVNQNALRTVPVN
jgi:predicted  nucleic acid-binding Zn-ribbon protein